MLYPIFQTVSLSFYNWDGLARTKQFIGLKNYLRLVQDPIFHVSLSHNLIWVALTIALPLLIGLILASILAGKIKGRNVFSTIYFIPHIIALVVAGTIWSWIYNPIFGLLNVVLKEIGLGHLARGWLGDPQWALISLNMVGNWTYFGFCVLIFLSFLQSVDPTVYEAAVVDGANSLQRFWHITIPALRGTIVFVTVYSTIGALKFFDLVYITTRGGPFHKTEVVSSYMFSLFLRQNRVSYAASISTVLTGIIFSLTVTILYFGWEKK